jgi:hypothetical protein
MEEKKVRGKPFKKGEFTPSPHNVKNAMTEEDKALRTMSRTFAKNIIYKHSLKTYKELCDALKHKDNIPSLELILMQVMKTAIMYGDIKKLDWIYAQIAKKQKEQIVEEKKIILSFQDRDGNDIPQERFGELETKDLKQIVNSMLKNEL